MVTIDYEIPVHKELQAGERLLWSGRPRRGFVVGIRDVPAMVFGAIGILVAIGFTITWFRHMHGRGPASWFIVFWAVPFVGMGVFGVFGRYIFETWRRRRVYYAVTDRRAIIVRAGNTRTVRSFPFAAMNEIDLLERADGSGTIWFGPRSMIEQRQTSFRMGGGGFEIAAFDHLADVREVYGLIQEAQLRERRERSHIEPTHPAIPWPQGRGPAAVGVP